MSWPAAAPACASRGKLPGFSRSRRVASTSCAPRGDRQGVAQRPARHTHVGARHAVVCTQRRFVAPFQVPAIQRELGGCQAQQRAGRCRARLTALPPASGAATRSFAL